MENYRIVRKINHQQWREFVLNHPQGNFFQTPEIFELFEKTGNYEPLFFSIQGKNEKMVGLLLAVIQKEFPGIMGYFSSRCIVWGGPIIHPSDSKTEGQVLGMLLNELIKKVRFRTIYIQVRNMFKMSCYSDVFQRYGFSYHEHLNYIVETGEGEETEKRISKSKIRQKKKSLKAGARIIEPGNIEQVEEFYNILKVLYKTKVKLPLPDWSFFKTFYELSKKNNKVGKYFFIEYNKKIVGGIMCPIYSDKTIYEWYICGLDGRHKNIYPSVAATWAPIDYTLKNGLKYFDFMGAGKPDQAYGVREFKSKFGGELVNFGRFERINNRFLYKLGKIGIKIRSILR